MHKFWSYEEVKEKAEAIKAIGYDEVYLSEGEYPWEIADECGGGGSHRLDIETRVWFYATDPDSGIKLRWSFDIESRSADGEGTYYIDVDGCREVMNKLKGKAQTQFREYLFDCAGKLQNHVDELYEHIKREKIAIDALRSICLPTERR